MSGLAGVLAVFALAAPPPARHLTFSDDFDGDAIDTTKWNVLSQAHDGGTYTSGMVRVQDGSLVLTTDRRNHSIGSEHFYVESGAVNTSGKFAQRLGRFEARVKLPGALNTDSLSQHNAIWLHNYQGSGLPNTSHLCHQEIDIMEQSKESDNSTEVVTHVHAYAGPACDSACDQMEAAHTTIWRDWSTDWHVFAAEWTEDSLTFEHDGKVVMAYSNRTVMAKMTDPEFFILSAAVMRDLPPLPTDRLPQHYYIDYVRIWQWDS